MLPYWDWTRYCNDDGCLLYNPYFKGDAEELLPGDCEVYIIAIFLVCICTSILHRFFILIGVIEKVVETDRHSIKWTDKRRIRQAKRQTCRQ